MSLSKMLNSFSIFLVEDDLDDQEFFIEAIEGIGNLSIYNVANNGQEALQMLDHPAAYPDYIFLDINMPKMNGLACLQAIRSKEETRNIPVIMLSTSTALESNSIALGASDFITKPSDLRILKTKLEQAIIHHQERQPICINPN